MREVFSQIILLLFPIIISGQVSDSSFKRTLEKDSFIEYFRYCLIDQNSEHQLQVYDSLYSKLETILVDDPRYDIYYTMSDSAYTSDDANINFNIYENYWDDTDFEIRARNVFFMYIDQFDSLTIKGVKCDFDTISIYYRDFILNPTNDIDLSEKRLIHIDELGEVLVSKGFANIEGHFEFDSLDNRSSWNTYFHLFHQIKELNFDLKDEFSLSTYDTPFNLLSVEKKVAVNSCFPFAVWFYFMKLQYFPPPPPPPREEIIDEYIRQQQEKELKKIVEKK